VLPAFSRPGTNLANLFNLTGITNRDDKETELWGTWIVGAAIAGKDVDTTLTVAVVDDLNQDGVFNDAPNVVPDLNNDGRIAAQDLERLGVASTSSPCRSGSTAPLPHPDLMRRRAVPDGARLRFPSAWPDGGGS